ncbi:MAG: hypothetical protein QOI62_1477 [Solirubrobacteraceae bacterium]|jgi:hypothetical protein|nr:hypothetical protein [Solirubrobacteraceae bacterium]
MSIDPLDALAGAAAGAAGMAFVATFSYGLRHPWRLLRRARKQPALLRDAKKASGVLNQIRHADTARVLMEWEVLATVAAETQGDAGSESDRAEIDRRRSAALASTHKFLAAVREGVEGLDKAAIDASWPTPRFKRVHRQLHEVLKTLCVERNRAPELVEPAKVAHALRMVDARLAAVQEVAPQDDDRQEHGSAPATP